MKPSVYLFILLFSSSQISAQERPNILWLSCEDISPHIGCFDDVQAITPNIDQLATEGVRYTNTFTTAGVCAPCRSGIITGVYQSSLGTHHMRCKAKLPTEIKPFPRYLRQAGYYCSNNSKEDYQFKTPKESWDQSDGKAHWRNNREPNRPFFSVFNFGGCHESGIASTDKYRKVTQDLPEAQKQDPTKLTLPPYYPDTTTVREDWKRNYELITAMDAWAGDLIQQLKDDGLYEKTIIFFWSDHGVGLPRAKRWLYDSGTRIPLVVRIPEAYRVAGQGIPGDTDDQLVSTLDFAPTMLLLAGQSIPKHMQGRAFLGKNLTQPHDYVYGARDRMDERYDIIRSVRDKRYRYIRNYEPFKPYYQYMNTPEKGATMRELRRVHAEGKLSKPSALFMASSKPKEELYDLYVDPHEVNNLATIPAMASILTRMRKVHLQWVEDTRDLGLLPESEIIQREASLGNRYTILRQEGGLELMRRVRDVANAASSGPEGLPILIKALSAGDPAVRYWAAIGLGNLPEAAQNQIKELHTLLKDDAPCVRIASARALARFGNAEPALPVLQSILTSPHQWARLRAAIVLDEMGNQARPAIAALKVCLENQPNKYISRVANRALNELLGTNNTVR